MEQGWIKLHRKMLHNPVVCKDSDHLALWVVLLLKATHKPIKALWKGSEITLHPGQMITGRKSLSVNSGIGESKVQRILKWFKSEQLIEQQTSTKNRLITVINWENYQISDPGEQQSEQQVNNKRTTSEQQVNTNKNTKNIKNDKEYREAIFENLKNLNLWWEGLIMKFRGVDLDNSLENYLLNFQSKFDWHDDLIKHKAGFELWLKRERTFTKQPAKKDDIDSLIEKHT